MKHFFWFSLLMVMVISACTPEGTGFQCREGVCIHLDYEGPVQASKPIEFTITVRTEKNVPNLGISLYGDYSITIQDIAKQPEAAKFTYQDQRSIDWLIETIGGEEYALVGHFVLDKPTSTFRLNSYGLIAAASKQSGFRVTDSISIYLDSEGNQVDKETAELLAETVPVVPDETGIIIFPTHTPKPTFPQPSPTTLPSTTPTLPGYPAP